MRTIVISERRGVADRLAELGLDLATLQDSLIRGQLSKDMCTANHPASFPGISAWADTNAALREFLIPEGWQRRDLKNIPQALSPDGCNAITAVTGDENTGNAHEAPMTKRPRGAAGIRAVLNNVQYNLFEQEATKPRDNDALVRTWFLLFHRVGDRLRSELSLPTAVSDAGIIEDWQERIILPELDLTEGPARERSVPEPEEVEVSIKPRAS